MHLYIMLHVASVYTSLQYWYGAGVSNVMHSSKVIDCHVHSLRAISYSINFCILNDVLFLLKFSVASTEGLQHVLQPLQTGT